MHPWLPILCAAALLASCAGDVRRKPNVAVPAAAAPSAADDRDPEDSTARREEAPTATLTPTPTPREEIREEPAPDPTRWPQEATREERAADPVEAPREKQNGEGAAARLAAIAAERRNLDRGRASMLGPGDLVSVTVFGVDEMTRRVRVSQGGTIRLPLIGSVEAAGRSEGDLARDIAARLRRDYMHDPQVDVFVEEYRSRQVAVTGAVANPGLFPLTRDRSTILDVISEAGGLTHDAGSVIEFIPARGDDGTEAFELARSAGTFSEELAGQGIQIELNDLMRGSNRASINVPVAAGDVIFVPEAGSFAIDGWVDRPGTYPITRGATVLGALSAGGGPLMPARLGSVRLLRSTSTTGEAREVLDVDVEAIKAGEQPDVELRSGDVIRVPANPLLVPPWAVYQLFRDLIRLGASVPVA